MSRKLIVRGAIIAGLILAILILLPVYVMSQFLGQRHYQPQYDPIIFGVEAERIALVTDDGLALAAWRTFTEEASSKGTVIIISGLEMPSVTAFFGYARMLADNGWDALLIEKRARSLSEGNGIGFGVTEWLDIKAGVDFLSQDSRVGDLPIITMGTSAGGAAVIIAGGEIPRIDGVIAISAYSNFIDLYVDGIVMFGLPRFLGVVTIPFMHLRMGLHFGFSALGYTPINGIAKLNNRPILLMHSTDDWQVPFRHFERLYQAAIDSSIDVSTFIREGDWHFVCYDQYINNPSQDIEFADAIMGFLSQFYD